MRKCCFAAAFAIAFAPLVQSSSSAQEYLNGIEWEKPPIIQPGATDDAPPVRCGRAV